MFSRQHYRQVAEIIQDINRFVKMQAVSEDEAYDVLVNALVLMFAEDNPKFNIVKFRQACKVGV